MISIAQPGHEIYCIVTFTKKHCVAQDLTSKKLIRVGEPKKGIYVFKEDLGANIQVNKVISNGLWHQRLGHPSNHALSKVSSRIQVDFSSNNDFGDVCPCAKQTRIMFPIAESKASYFFDLIHLSLIHI